MYVHVHHSGPLLYKYMYSFLLLHWMHNVRMTLSQYLFHHDVMNDRAVFVDLEPTVIGKVSFV